MISYCNPLVLVVEPSSLWGQIWSIKVPSKVKSLNLCASFNILSTVYNLLNKYVVVEIFFHLCRGNT